MTLHHSRNTPATALRAITGPQWYCLLIGLFLLIRGASTLLAGASFAAPGDGWRASLQLAVAAVLAYGLVRRPAARIAVLAVGVLYTAETTLGLVNGRDILGLIPIDMRDKIVHPVIAVLAALALVTTLGSRRVNRLPA
jgi:hypothetical protein